MCAAISLIEIWESLQGREFLDLTHALDIEIPRWHGYPPMEVRNLFHYERDGFRADLFTHVGQYGTHLDPPAHFIPGGRTIDEIPVKDFILPCCVVDVSSKVERNPDYQLSVEDLRKWEERHGRFPARSLVVNHSGWGRRWLDIEAFENRDPKGGRHYPGWSLSALKFLFEEREVLAIGHESPDTDAAFTGVFDCQRYVHASGRWQVELLANVHRLPPKGALVVIGVPKPARGSGFPARVFAILP